MELVLRHFEAGRVGQHDLCLLEALVGLVDDGLVEHARLRIFLFHVEVDVGHAVVEDTLGDFHRGRLLLHAEEERSEIDLGFGRGLVLEVKGNAHHEEGKNGQGPHDAQKGHAGRLHGQELEALAHVAERNEGREQHSQRKGLGHEGLAHIPEELGEDFERKPLADELVDVAPGELHHEDKEAYKESSYENQQELAQYVSV